MTEVTPTNKQSYPCIFLHGVGLNSDAWADYANHFTAALMLNIPGHGDCTLLAQKNPDIDDYGRWLLEELHRRKIYDFHLIGHSMGALIAITSAILSQSSDDLRCHSLTAISAVHRRSEKAQAAIFERLEKLKINPDLNLSSPLARWFGEPCPKEYQNYRYLCQQWLQSVNRTGYQRAYSAFAKGATYTNDDLSTLKTPSLFITGELDGNSTAKMSHQLAECVINGTSLEIKNAGHMLTMTHSATIIELINEHIKQAEIK